nr:DUF4166 domain-containing protein [Chiayiivirga flava]
MFEALLGPDFARLPPTVQRLHAACGERRYLGHGEVRRGAHPLARLCCAVARLPPAFSGAMAVDMQSTARDERWIRRFGRHAMPSRLQRHTDGLMERLGPLRFVFVLAVRDATLHWRVRSVHLFGLPLPARWFAGVGAREFEDDGRYRYDVVAVLPRIGTLVHYRGWLDVDAPVGVPAA